MKKKSCLFTVFIILAGTAVFAQEPGKKEAKEEGAKGMHRLSLVIGHSHISQGINSKGKREWKIVPSWGLDYDYWITDHWALGLQNDMMVESFEVEDHDNKVIERERPFSSVVSVLFKPKKHVSFIAGMGGEFAKEENFALTRLGIESGWEMKGNWEFGVSLLYDIKWNAYDTWVLGFGVSKLLGKKRPE